MLSCVVESTSSLSETDNRTSVKSAYQKFFFLFSHPKHMLLVLKRDGSFEHPKHMLNTMGKKIFTILVN